MKNGMFPASGAELTFKLAQPLPPDKVALIANWDLGDQTWVPLTSQTSEDGTTVSAKLEHFSTYGLLDVSRNVIGGLVGVRTSPPECIYDPPSWDDKESPQFFDDLNGPVLWCATSDPDHPDELVIKLKVNRGAGASITTSVTPVSVYSDLWETLKPETWATMVLGRQESLIPNPNAYFIQPTGEYEFRFAKTDVMNFWHSNRTLPLVEVNTSPADVLAGLLYTLLSGVAPGNDVMFLVTSAMAVTQCTSDITTSVGDLALSPSSIESLAPKISGALRVIASCLEGQSEFVAQSAASYLAARNPAFTLRDLVNKTKSEVKRIVLWARIVAAIQVLTPVVEALTDWLLDPIARQFIFQPSDHALKEYVQNNRATIAGLPRELEGRWCSKLNPVKCFSVAEKKAQYPELFMPYSGPADDAPGATDYAFCIEHRPGAGSSCQTAASIFVRYYPSGVGWDCTKNHFQLPTCDPDHSSAHDLSKPRLVVLPNHQQGKAYYDSEPMYLVSGN